MDTAQEILDSAARLFARFGYRKTTVADIARESGVAKGSIYLHYDSKQDLFLRLIQQRLVENLDRLDAALAAAASDRSAIADGLVTLLGGLLEARREMTVEEMGIDLNLAGRIIDLHRRAQPRLARALARPLESFRRRKPVTYDTENAAWLLSETTLIILVRTARDTEFDWRRYINTMIELLMPAGMVETT